MTVSAVSSTLSAISLGVRWRSEPSTRAIIRSTKDWPGSLVIRTTIRSESTVVPPVTALRSPPDSRITGRGLTGDGRLVDRGDALDDLAVAGDPLAGHDHDHVAGAQAGARHLVGGQLGQVAGVLQRCRCRRGPGAPWSPAAGRAGWRPGPCRGPRPRTRPGCAKSTVSHSQTVTSQPMRARVDDRQHGGGHRADLDHQHDRGADQLARVELAQGAGQRLAQLAARWGLGLGAGDGSSVHDRDSTTGPRKSTGT